MGHDLLDILKSLDDQHDEPAIFGVNMIVVTIIRNAGVIGSFSKLDALLDHYQAMLDTPDVHQSTAEAAVRRTVATMLPPFRKAAATRSHKKMRAVMRDYMDQLKTHRPAVPAAWPHRTMQ